MIGKSVQTLIKNPLFFIPVVLFLFANSGAHPTSGSGGYTGAPIPNEGVCAQCHGGSNSAFNGTITLDGVPASISPSTAYQITVTVSNPNGNATRAGFQMIAINSNNTNAGNFTNPSSSSSVKTVGTKKYFGHSPAVAFGGSNPVSWTIDWTSPATGSGDIVFYATAILGNGSGSGGDKMVAAQESGAFAGASPLSATISNVTHVSCYNGNDGSATVNPAGGGGSYTYNWSSGETTQTAVQLTAGTASVTVTDNLASSTIKTVTINQPTQLQANAININGTSCYNTENGSATITASGGTPGYTYTWSNGNTTATANNLAAGLNEVTVTDNKGCEKAISFTIPSPPAIVVTSNKQNPLCNNQSNGFITLTAQGGTGALTYLWSNGATTAQIQNLAAGVYSVTVSDANNCEWTNAYTLTNPPSLSAAIAKTNLTCFNSNNGTATANVTGGATPLLYSWSNGQTTKTINNLAAGTYGVTITDANQCTITNTTTITAPPAILINSTTTNASCQGISNGSAVCTVSGGAGGFTYLWSNGSTSNAITNVTSGSYGLTVTDISNCTNSSTIVIGADQAAILSVANTTPPTCSYTTNGNISINVVNAVGYNLIWSNGSTTPTIQNLGSGIFSVQATNPQGCTSNLLEINLSGPAAITSANTSIVNPLCNGQANGSITTNYSGGTGNLSYSWSNNATTASLNNVNAGVYGLTVTDSNNCQKIEEHTLINPAPLSAGSTSVTHITCPQGNNGSIALSPSGGVGNLTTSWSNGVVNDTVSNLIAGVYNYTIVDTNQCSLQGMVDVNQPNPFATNEIVTNETTQGSNNGSIALHTTGGSPPYQYLWSNGATTDSIGGLAVGLYSVTITDLFNCIKLASFNVQSGGCALSATVSTHDVTCFGGNDGKITIEMSGGQAPYTFSSPNTNLQAGTYTIGVTDNAGCVYSVSNITINQPPQLIVTVDSIVNATSATTKGTVFITTSGGNGGNNTQWVDSMGMTVSTLEDPNLLPGAYTLIVNDSLGCEVKKSNIVIGFTSSIGLESDFGVSIYPNPTLNTLNVTCNYNGALSLRLYDLQGKNVITKTNLKADTTIDMSQLNSGTYLVYISNGYTTKQLNVIKQ